MLGDAIVYGFSLYVVARGAIWQTRAALLKGSVMAAFAIGILVEVGAKLARDVTPSAGLMSLVGVLALVANAAALGVLRGHRADDMNMRSAWLGNCLTLDAQRFVKTGLDLTPADLEAAQWPLRRRPLQFETSLPRVFAVGDVRSGSMKRVASAVGEGSAAVQLVHKVLAE